jgi:hypothetical protein
LPQFPDDEEYKRRADRWSELFTHYENCDDTEEDGLDMNELVAQAEADDEMDGILQDGNEEFDEIDIDSDSDGDEAIEDNSEVTAVDLALAANPNMSDEQKIQLIMSEYPDFPQLKEAYEARKKQVAALNLPYWNPPE